MQKFFLGSCLLASSALWSQNCDLQLHIQVIDFHNGQPLEETVVTNSLTGETVFSDENGELTFSGLCPGMHYFALQHVYCEPSEKTIELTQNESVTWFLEHHIVELEGTETVGFQQRAVSTQAETHLHEEDMERSSAETIGFVLKNVSGVSGLETGNSIIKPMIHGMHSSRIIMLNNGVRQEDMEWGAEHAPNMDLNAFHDIRVLKGASALRYGGDAIGGIILTEYPRLPKTDTITGKIGATGILNGRGGNLTTLVQKGFNSKWAMQLQGSYKKHGDFKAPDYYLTNSGSSQKAVMAEVAFGDFRKKISVNYSFIDSEIGILQAAHFGNLIDLADAINAPEPFVSEDFSYEIQKPYQHVTHHLAGAKFEKRFAKLGKLETGYAFQFNKRREFDVRTGEVTDVPSMDVELSTHSLEAVMTFDKRDEFVLETGLNGSFQHNYSDPATQNKRLIPDYDKLNAGAFASLTYRPVQQWTLNAGLRYDFAYMDTKKYYYKRYWERMNYDADFAQNIIGDFGNEWLTHFQLDFHNVSATLGAAWRPDNTQEISLNYALANRPPNPAELFSEGLHHSAVSIELGDVRIQPETAHKISARYNRQIEFLSGLNFNILGYYNHIQNFIYQIPTGADYTIRGSFPVWSFLQTDAEIYGFDADLDLEISPEWSYQTKFSYVHGQNTEQDLPLIHMPPFSWQQEMRFESQENLMPFVAVSSEFTAKQNRFPDYNFSINVLENGEDVSRLIDLSSTPSSYWLMHAEAGLTFNAIKNPVKLTARVRNLLNTGYRNYLNRFRYFTDETGRQIQLQIIYNF